MMRTIPAAFKAHQFQKKAAIAPIQKVAAIKPPAVAAPKIQAPGAISLPTEATHQLPGKPGHFNYG